MDARTHWGRYRSGDHGHEPATDSTAHRRRNRPSRGFARRPSTATPSSDTAIAVFLAALSLIAYVGRPRRRSLVGADVPAAAREPAADRAPPVPARGPGRLSAAVDPPRGPPRGPVPGGPRHPRRGSTPSASASTAGRRSPTALTARAPGVVFIGRAGLSEVAPTLIQTELIFVVAWLLGDATRIRRLYAGTLEERAQRERERDERPRAPSARSASGSPASCTTSSPTT